MQTQPAHLRKLVQRQSANWARLCRAAKESKQPTKPQSQSKNCIYQKAEGFTQPRSEETRVSHIPSLGQVSLAAIAYQQRSSLPSLSQEPAGAGGVIQW